jgi:hypothetical protein
MHLYHNDLLDDPLIIQARQFYLSRPCRQSEDTLLWRIGLGTSVLVDELATSQQLPYVITTLSSLFYTVLPIQNALLHISFCPDIPSVSQYTFLGVYT